MSALSYAALGAYYRGYCRSHLGLVQWLLENGVSSITETTDDSHATMVWNMLTIENAGAAELSSLLKVMVMLADAPAYFIAKLSPQHAELAMRGRQLRAQLPAYVEQQRALVLAHCPLPAVLQPLVAAYAATTPEDMWMDGLL